ncbi:hypothetical protein roselon_00852 [Roseibacterium elongatum DSM 19469]|uniref:Lipoprotein n=1 Tax=Roseicyclus elongatus DSM 19469 TaxID=1294273 RepID=W8RZF5_9RHOB|nr:DUF3576 domain-containing protein [Roseibacterium elongatum]AHM03262.1 hypothetical protein roselon_00852 [Roseibacterium elongatum DSM 19469]
MTLPLRPLGKMATIMGLALLVSGCAGAGADRERQNESLAADGLIVDDSRETLWDLFGGGDDPNTSVEVNRYLWQASLEILDFMPIEAADPFTGIIAYGYGTPPGGGTAYRATVYITDPALEARSLRIALQTRGGPVSRETARQIEDAILTRARQIRIRDGGL